MDSLHTSASPEPITKQPPKSPEAVSQSGDRPPSRPGTRPPEPEHLPCPRCDSTNTKFCYYNNYNLSQPRHFCKSCRRYWTRGGALRNVPVGGGTRKSNVSSSNKRPRRIPTTSDNNNENGDTGTTQVLDPNPVPGSVEGGPVNLNEAKSGSTLNCMWSNGLFPLNSYGAGLGLGSGPGLGYDHGLLDWPMEEVSREDGGPTVVRGEYSGCSTWQVDSGVAIADGDYFCLPELAISTPAKALK